MLNIGGEANEVNVDRAVASLERGPIRHELDEPITNQEGATEINKMKISSAGDDEVNILVIRQAAPEVREDSVQHKKENVFGWDALGPGCDSRGRRCVVEEKELAGRPGQVQRYISFEFLLQDFGPCLGKAVVGGGRQVQLVVDDSVGLQVGPQRCGCGHDFPNPRRGPATRESPHDESITF